MKKFILALIAASALLTVPAFAEGIYGFENDLSAEAGDAISVVNNTLGAGGSAAYSAAEEGTALDLNGSYGVNLGTVGTSFSVSARVKVASSGDTKTLFFKNMGSSSSEKWMGVIFRNGVPTVWSHDNGSFKWAALTSTASSCLDKWVNIKYVEQSGAAELYVDGSLVASGTVVSGSGTLYMGSTFWPADAISASVDNLRFFNSVFDKFDFGTKYLVSDLDLSAAGTGVEWSSDNEAVISSAGKVTRSENDVTVTLTGTHKLSGVTRKFTFTVLGLPKSVNSEVLLSYDLSNNSGGIIPDASGNNNHAVSFGSMTGTHFDGADDYVQLPEGLLQNLDNFTIAMRLSPEIVSTHQFTFCFGNSTSEYLFLNTSRPGTNTIRLALTKEGSEKEKDVRSLPGLRNGEEAWVTIVFEGSKATMYENGMAVASGDLGFAPRELGATTQNWLAKSPYNDPLYRGDIYEFAIYPRALSAEEISQTQRYPETTPDGYISDISLNAGRLEVHLSRDCMVSALFFDKDGNVMSSSTGKVSDDKLTVDFDCNSAAGAEIAAYDAATGIIRDRRAVAIYGGLVAYTENSGCVKLVNTNPFEVSAVLISAKYADGALASIDATTVTVGAGSYEIFRHETDGARLMVWSSLSDMKPLLEQK